MSSVDNPAARASASVHCRQRRRPSAVLDTPPIATSGLREVRFADVDASTLAELATSTMATAEVVAAAEAELLHARRTLQERQDALLANAQRGLAYARVYADNDPALLEKLDQIALPRAARRPRAGGDALVLEPDPSPRSRPSAEGSDPTAEPTRRPNAPRKQRSDVPTLAPDLKATG